MSTQLFEKHIHDLNFSLLEDKEKSGVLLTNNFENIDSDLASPSILFALESAWKKQTSRFLIKMNRYRICVQLLLQILSLFKKPK